MFMFLFKNVIHIIRFGDLTIVIIRETQVDHSTNGDSNIVRRKLYCCDIFLFSCTQVYY
jgi:hypothetical protein